MTGPELKQLRHDLGDAIGQRLTEADMARLCGLKDPERNGKDTMRKSEDGDGPSGPVAELLKLVLSGLTGSGDPGFFRDYLAERLGRPVH